MGVEVAAKEQLTDTVYSPPQGASIIKVAVVGNAAVLLNDKVPVPAAITGSPDRHVAYAAQLVLKQSPT